MKKYIGIDPGPEQTAYVVIEPVTSDKKQIRVLDKGKISNGAMLKKCRDWDDFNDGDIEAKIGIEMIASYGMPVGKEVFETCVFIGRMLENLTIPPTKRITRNEVKNHICHSSRAKDSNIRQALVDRYGKPGTKKNPGVTYELFGDMWAALAVAVTLMETEE